MNLFLLHFKKTKWSQLTANFVGKRPSLVNTQLPLNMMNLVIREVECDTCDGSPRRSETFFAGFGI